MHNLYLLVVNVKNLKVGVRTLQGELSIKTQRFLHMYRRMNGPSFDMVFVHLKNERDTVEPPNKAHFWANSLSLVERSLSLSQG